MLFLKFIFKFVFFAIFIFFFLCIGIIFYLTQDMPALDKLKITSRNPSVTILSKDSEIIGAYGDMCEDMVRVQNLPPYVAKALISVEDKRFYEHFGLDLKGLFRALYKNYKTGHVVQGGSTITQQLAKNFLISQGAFLPTDRSIKRKVQELLMALKLEWKFSKDDILTLYLNRVDFGSNTFGIEAASRKFFDKPASELSLFEAAVIVGVLKATTSYSPIRSPKKATERAKLVLSLMKEEGYIDSVEINPDSLQRKKKIFESRYYSDWVLSIIPNYIGRIDKDLVVLTSFDSFIQQTCESSIQKVFQDLAKRLNVTQVSMVVMDYFGQVLSIVGGLDYSKSQYNRATKALRPPGSAFKTFVFLAGLENGMTPETLIDDSPYSKQIGNKLWKLSNFRWQSRGEISLKLAFAKSVNSIPPKILDIIGIEKVIEIVKRLGLTQDFKPDPSLAIGTGETTLLELTGAYATFPNGGIEVWPYGISEIRDKDGNILYQREEMSQKQILSETVVLQMKEMLSAVIGEGTGRNARPAIGGKTGSNGDKDAWFIGYDSKYVIGVWVGNDNNNPMKKQSVGSNMPAKIASEFFKAIEKCGKDSIEEIDN